jgi:hypothetical protein
MKYSYHITVEVLFVVVICIQQPVQLTESRVNRIFVIPEYLANHHAPLQVSTNEAWQVGNSATKRYLKIV